MLSVGAPRREKRLRIDTSALYIVRGCSVRRRLTKQFANLPHKISYGNCCGNPGFIPHEKSLRILCGDPGFLPHEKSCGFYVGTPDSAVENAVIRMRCKEKASFSRGAYLVVRNPQFCPTENAFGGGPGLYPTKNPAYFLRGPRFIPHEKSCGFYAGTPVLLIIVCKNRDFWMKCAKAPIFRTRRVLGVRKRSEYGG